MIIETLVVGMIQANCFIVGDPATRKAVVIDPGGDAPVIAKRLKALELTAEAIVLTHGHFDHVEGAGDLKKLTNVPIIAHVEDVPLIKALPAQGQLFGLTVTPANVPDKTVKDGDEIPFGTLKLKVLHTPGHSPGSVSLVAGKDVFVGDLLFAGSIGRTDLMGGNYDTLINSVEKKVFTLPEDTVVHPGHGPDTSVGREKRTNPFFR